MIIHVVQLGETINSIADSYEMSAAKIIQDNELENPNNLVVGQCLVIAVPEKTYLVQEGDTLQGIADSNNITLMQLYRNNPFLSEREYIYPGETLVIKYNNSNGKIAVHGNTFPFINNETLKKTLPYLTYLSIINYTTTNNGDITSYYDDTDIIKLSKDYGVMPLMLLTPLTIKGEARIGIDYDILLNKDIQNKQIQNMLNILSTKGYFGINIAFQYIDLSNLKLYEGYLTNVSNQLKSMGYYIFVTINPSINIEGNENEFKKINYTIINQLSHNIIFMNYELATNINPPSPISSINNINVFLDYINKSIPPEKVIIGIPTIGYDWELPFVAGISNVSSLTVNNSINLARDVNAMIQFDEISQTPFFEYSINGYGNHQIDHIVWFIDARSINALLELISKYKLLGTSIWNITIYNAQLWLIINSQYEIEKII